MTIVRVWHQQEDLLIPRRKTLPMAEFRRRIDLSSECSHGTPEEMEPELVPHAEVLSHLTRRRTAAQGGSVAPGWS
jgi:hypothetical protein